MLNISIKQRIRQIELNLERWRWILHDLGRRYVVVNIAGFTLRVVESAVVRMEMGVVVGKPFRRTPVFSWSMTYLVINPFRDDIYDRDGPLERALQERLPAG